MLRRTFWRNYYNYYMRDLKIIVPEDRKTSDWNMDIDVIDGYPTLLSYERNTQDQRAALAAYTVMGTIPGMPNVGVDWSLLYNQGATIIDLDNSIKQAIQEKAAVVGTANQNYMPIYTKDDEGIHVAIYQSS